MPGNRRTSQNPTRDGAAASPSSSAKTVYDTRRLDHDGMMNMGFEFDGKGYM
jgi:hypothetical protein